MDVDARQAITEANGAVLAAEEWANTYADTPDAHKQLIALMAKLETELLEYFHDMAKRASSFISWGNYHSELREVIADASNDYNVNIVVDRNALKNGDAEFVKIVFDTLAAAAALGHKTGEEIAGIPIIGGSVADTIQALTTEQIANLVGKKVVDGKLVDNPDATYAIDDTTRARIASSIKESIRLGENQKQATKRLQQVIDDPKRAAMIARTEAVNAFQKGKAQYARDTGAIGKKWVTYGAVDICSDNAAQGVIPVWADFVSGDPEPVAHPNCKCDCLYYYPGDTETLDLADWTPEGETATDYAE